MVMMVFSTPREGSGSIEILQASSPRIQGRMELSDPLYKEVHSQQRVGFKSSFAMVNTQDFFFVTLSLSLPLNNFWILRVFKNFY